jgi:zinc transport system substrate-binding protein
VTQRAVDADAFLYVAAGSQPWADDVVRNVRDGDSDTHLIAAREGVDLLPAGEEHDDHDEEQEADGHDGESHDDHAADEGHDHGSVDPHFWLGPTRTATAVETVRDGLQELDADNADAYRESLLALDAEFEDALADRARDAVLVAGHDSLQYLGERYGFEVVALNGLSPDDSATTDDVRRAQAAIDDHGIRHVLAPVMESDQAARSLVADTDAEDVLPITALPGRHEKWTEQGWGYADVMREVNLSTLTTALGAR